jgi:type II secretory pathway pseudopilin PulG
MNTDMGTQRRLPVPWLGDEEAGFTIVESMAAAVILLVAVVLTITPVAVAMRGIDRSKEVTVLENLAQGRIEEVRSLDYVDVGNPGYAPDGILERTVGRVVDGRTYYVDTDVQYVGSDTGLDVVPQGGDGVEGAFDPGVNYKYVTVTVRSAAETVQPIEMDTIVAPPTIGALENVAIVEVDLLRHEPYDPYLEPYPTVQIIGPATYLPHEIGETQYFPDVLEGSYDTTLFADFGWRIHPDSITSGASTVQATAGLSTGTVIKLYQPASLTVSIEETDGTPISTATVTIEALADGSLITNSAGDYAFDDLVPGPFAVRAVAPGFLGNEVIVDVPGPGGTNSTSATLVLEPGSVATTVDATFTVDHAGWADYFVHGAEVIVRHSVLGEWSGTTDADGNVTLSLPANEIGFTVRAQTPAWGHEGVDTFFDTSGTAMVMTLSLSQPANTDLFYLYNGPTGPDNYYMYRVRSDRTNGSVWSEWTTLLSNSGGRATFIVPEQGNRRVNIQAYCADGTLQNEVNWRLTGSNRGWGVNRSCP